MTVFAFPLYIDSIPAKLKAFLDRQFINVMPVFVPYHNLTRHPLWKTKERYIALFSINGYPEIEHFKPVVETFKGIARNSHKPLVAAILRPGAQFLYEVPVCRNYLKKVLVSLEEAGKELVEQGKISKRTLKSIQDNYGISQNQWHRYANLYWFLRKREVQKE